MDFATTMSNAVVPLRSVQGLPEASRVDTASHVIYAASVIQAGPLNLGDPRPWTIDDTTLSQVVSLGNSFPRGVKCRFAHPSFLRDGLGSFLGRWRNFRQVGDAVLADLHLAPIAFKGGDGSRGKYVEDLAVDDPESFGVSIFPVLDHRLMAFAKNREGLEPMRLTKLIAADVVDEPAATRGGLFGGLSTDAFEEIATAWLDHTFPDANPDAIRAFGASVLQAYFASRPPQPTAIPATAVTSAAVTTLPAAVAVGVTTGAERMSQSNDELFGRNGFTPDELHHLNQNTEAIAEYRGQLSWMLKNGTPLVGYVETWRKDNRKPGMPGPLSTALAKIQDELGQPATL